MSQELILLVPIFPRIKSGNVGFFKTITGKSNFSKPEILPSVFYFLKIFFKFFSLLSWYPTTNFRGFYRLNFFFLFLFFLFFLFWTFTCSEKSLKSPFHILPTSLASYSTKTVIELMTRFKSFFCLVKYHIIVPVSYS